MGKQWYFRTKWEKMVLTIMIGSVVHRRIRPAVRRVKCIRDRFACVMLKGGWCDFRVNLHAHQKIRAMTIKYSFYEEVGRF